MKNKKSIDRLFSSKFDSFEASAPFDAWDNINLALNQKRKSKKKIFINRMAASAAVLFAFGLGMWYSNLQNTQNSINKGFFTEQTPISRGFQRDLPDFVQPKIKETAFLSNNSTLLKENTPHHTITNKNVLKNQSLYKAQYLEVNYVEPTEIAIIQSPKYHYDYTPIEQLLAPDFAFVETEVNQKEQSRWLLGGEMAPTYSYRMAQSNLSYSSTYTGNSNENKLHEEGIMSMAGGLRLGYQINKRISINTGVYYAQIGQSTDNVLFAKEQPVASNDLYVGNTSAGQIVSNQNKIVRINQTDNQSKDPDRAFSNVELSNMIQNFEYIEIPLMAKYLVLDKKIDLQLIGGLNTGFLVGNDIFLKEGNKKIKIGETDNINKYIYNTVTGIGVQYTLNSRFNFSIEPTMKYSLLSINKNNQFDYRPYSFGLFTGITYSLNK